MKSVQRERVLYYDCLRVVACFAVVVLHTAAKNWYTTDVSTVEWQMMNLYDSVVRWSVPVFVMISGALFLNEEHSLKTLYGKNILRMGTAYVFWSVIYAVVSGGGIKNILISIVAGHYHMWFIPMIVGLYICVPLLRKFVENEQLMQYFLVLAVVFHFALPQMVQLANDFGGSSVSAAANVAAETMNNMNLYLVCGYAGYFVAGYCMSKKELSRRNRWLLYASAGIGLVLTAGLNAVLALRTGAPVDTYYGNNTVNVLAVSLAVFVWMKEHPPRNEVWKKWVVVLSKYSFGAYLIHALVLDLMSDYLGIHSMTFHPALSIPVISLVVFAVSLAASALLHQIPLVNKYVV